MNFSKLIWCEPWLAPVVLNIKNIIETENIETVCVTPDGKTLYYNAHFWKKLKKEEQLGVELHEVLHIVNRHASRRNYRIHPLWNIACDIAVNYQIKASGYKLPSGAIEGENDTAENIYDKLFQNNNLNFANKTNKKKSLYCGKGLDTADCLPKSDDGGKNILEGDLLRYNADGTEACNNSDTMEAIYSAVQLAGRGSSPLARAFRPRRAKANWKIVLQSMIKSVIGDDTDYLAYEFDEFGICEDILSAKPVPKICVLIDESASIEDELYEQFLGELFKMSRYACVYVSGFTDNTELNAVPLKKYRRTMTGGTDVTTAYKQACRKDFDCIIILTDGFLTFPQTEPKPTVWAMPESFGRKTEVIF